MSYGVAGKQTFFGYYDLTPFSEKNAYLLAMVTPPRNNSPYLLKEAKIGYFNYKSCNIFNEVGSTTTWCWQQGCRLQWYPAEQNNQIIYNKIVDNDYGSIIQDINTKKVLEVFNSPIYDVCQSGKWALSLNFSRLHRLRPGYGYANYPDKTVNESHPREDGIWLVDLTNNQKQLILPLSHLTSIDLEINLTDAQHHVNHLSFNPSANRFLFLHLIWKQNGERYQRLMTSNLDGSDLCALPYHASISHYTWKTDKEILVTTAENKYLSWVDQTNILREEFDTLQLDGHPSYSPNKKYLITDTIPDKCMERQLILVELEEQKITCLLRQYSPLKYYGEYRCDFHPRWDREGEYVAIDSILNGLRAINLVKVNTGRRLFNDEK